VTGLTACSDQNKTVISTKEPEKVKDVKMQQRAEQTYEAIQKSFYVPTENLYLEHFQAKSDDKAFSYLWPYSGMISALNALAKLPGNDGKKYREQLVKVLDGLEQYWDGDSTPPGYDSYIRRGGGGQSFMMITSGWAWILLRLTIRWVTRNILKRLKPPSILRLAVGRKI